MKCDVCENEIKGETDYRVLTLSYVTKASPKKRSPYRKEYMGMIAGTSNISFFQGYNIYIDEAKICENCQESFNEIMDQLKDVFHPLQGSVKEVGA